MFFGQVCYSKDGSDDPDPARFVRISATLVYRDRFLIIVYRCRTTEHPYLFCFLKKYAASDIFEFQTTESLLFPVSLRSQVYN